VKETKKMTDNAKKIRPRPSISVTGATYDRLRASYSGSLGALIDDLVTIALDDPAIAARVVAACQNGLP
jgi:hypothetical protein